ncbi:MAG: arsenosugar biosynthesis radical SAM protein ArsS [Bryobacterales bacterium]
MSISSLNARGHDLATSAAQLRVLEDSGSSLPAFDDKLAEAGLYPLTATGIEIFQINVGKLCNQTCKHCHVDAGPDRRESMTRRTAELCLQALEQTGAHTLDITGGAPELNPSFRYLVEQARRLGRHVIDRCNLTVLTIAPQADLADFLAEHKVEVVASLPYFLADRTDAQRGEGVFEKSIEGMRKLNALGYGREGTGLELNLVYNPVGAFLPPPQQALERDFKRELSTRYGVAFNSLYTITNMPISRFLEFLMRSGNYERYMQKLVQAFNPAAARGVMCRNTLSVGWDGALYDCDFNQMLDMPVGFGAPAHLEELVAGKLETRRIATGQHCYGCTAGAGSSCGGATA